MDLKNELESMYEYFYKEKGDMERSMLYKDVIKQIPEIKEIWDQFKLTIEEAHIIFQHRMEKIIETIP